MFSIAQKTKGPKPQPAEVAGNVVRCRYSTVALIGADGSGDAGLAGLPMIAEQNVGMANPEY